MKNETTQERCPTCGSANPYSYNYNCLKNADGWHRANWHDAPASAQRSAPVHHPPVCPRCCEGVSFSVTFHRELEHPLYISCGACNKFIGNFDSLPVQPGGERATELRSTPEDKVESMVLAEEPCPDCGSHKHRSCDTKSASELGICDSQHDTPKQLHAKCYECVNWKPLATENVASPQVKGLSGHYAEHLSTHVRAPEECPTCIAIERGQRVSVASESGGAREWLEDNYSAFCQGKIGIKELGIFVDGKIAEAESRVSALKAELEAAEDEIGEEIIAFGKQEMELYALREKLELAESQRDANIIVANLRADKINTATEALLAISGIAPGHGDVCELIARRARAALADLSSLAKPEVEAQKEK